ncbi:MAG: metal-dependent hydrolase [Steroidobacteraceae bacterium]
MGRWLTRCWPICNHCCTDRKLNRWLLLDNLTHTLIGVIAGEAVARCTRPSADGLAAQERRNLFVTLAAVASNLPDVDILWTLQGVRTDPLVYLLHHRGHTHTLLGCLGLLLLLQASTLLWLRWRGRKASSRDRWMLGAVSALGLLLHLGMDALNSYGVHPFWPFDNRWYYGDAVFIVEPLYWLAAIPGLFLLRTRCARAVVILAALAALALTTWLHAAQPWYYSSVVGLAVLLALIGWRSPARVAVCAGLAATVMLTGGFMLASALAGARVARDAAASFPGARTRDIVLTPGPTDPRCWDLLLLQTERGQYVARQGRLSLAAAPVAACASIQLGSGRSAALTPVHTATPDPAGVKIKWVGQYQMPLAQLAGLVHGDCRAQAAMGFIRAPFVVLQQRGWLLGDLRFDREVEPGFAEPSLPAAPSGHCTGAPAPWLPPRADILRSP